MEIKHSQPPDFSDKTKWSELKEKREIFFSAAEKILLPVIEKRCYHEAQGNIMDVGLGLAFIFFNQETPLILWSRPSLNNNRVQYVGYAALRMKNGKWAISNPLINYIYAENGGINLFQIYVHSIKEEEWATGNSPINCISIENKGLKILQIDIRPTEVWIIFKARNGWCLRKIKKSP